MKSIFTEINAVILFRINNAHQSFKGKLNMWEKTENKSFTIPLGSKAHEIAHQASQAIYNPEKNPDKEEQAYLNSLAVYAVNYYLKILGFETEFEKSSTQNDLLLKFLTEADLLVTNIGTLECIPVQNNIEYCEISPEVWSDRIGYVIVKLSTSRREAVILGFSKTPLSKISWNELKSVDDLIDYLTDKEEVAAINIP
jgi:hypothetical protein